MLETQNFKLVRNFCNYTTYSFTDPGAPPRPPLPSDGYGTHMPARPPPPPTLDTTDDESEDLFQHAPTASQGPIMVRIFDELKPSWKNNNKQLFSS